MTAFKIPVLAGSEFELLASFSSFVYRQPCGVRASLSKVASALPALKESVGNVAAWLHRRARVIVYPDVPFFYLAIPPLSKSTSFSPLLWEF
jgi:hypothetical protein